MLVAIKHLFSFFIFAIQTKPLHSIFIKRLAVYGRDCRFEGNSVCLCLLESFETGVSVNFLAYIGWMRSWKKDTFSWCCINITIVGDTVKPLKVVAFFSDGKSLYIRMQWRETSFKSTFCAPHEIMNVGKIGVSTLQHFIFRLYIFIIASATSLLYIL